MRPDNTQYLALADRNGKEQNLIKLDTLPDEDIHLESWAANGKYLTIMNKVIWDRSGRIRFFSVPDLQTVALKNNMVMDYHGCERPIEDFRLFCNPWSKTGHRAAFIHYDSQNTGHLITINVGETSEQMIPLSLGDFEVIHVSPSGKMIVVVSSVPNQDIKLSSDGYVIFYGNLDVYSADGKIQATIDEVAIAGIGGAESKLEPEIAVSDKLVIYARYNATNSETMQVLVYFPETKEKRLLLSDLKINDYDFRISPDQRFAAVFTPSPNNKNNILYLINLDQQIVHTVRHISTVHGKAEWSSDSQFLAVTMEDTRKEISVITANGVQIQHIPIMMHADTLSWTPCSMIP